MTMTELRRALEPLGWQFEGTYLASPGGSSRVTASDLASPLKLYLPTARRREIALRDEDSPYRKEYEDLMRVLEEDPTVSQVVSLVRAMGEIVTGWAAEHGATVTLWDFSLPAVRATARHPQVGIACLDCQLEDNEVSVLTYHWWDGISTGIRRSWREDIGPFAVSTGPLRVGLDQGLRLLLESHELISSTPLSGGSEAARSNRAWEEGFDVIH
jgi:hypothetical protein